MDSIKGLFHRGMGLLSDLYHWVEGLAATPYGGGALFVIAFAESSFFPIPPDVLLIPLCLGEPRLAFWFAAVCSAGSVLGGLAGYALGYYGGRPLVRRLFAAEKVAAVERYYDRYNAWAIGIAGLTPLPYKLFTVSGGACAIRLRPFVIASVLSRSARFFAVAGLLYLYGEPVRAFIDEYFEVLSVAFVVLLVLGFWLVGKGMGRAGGAEAADDDGPAAETPARLAREGADE